MKSTPLGAILLNFFRAAAPKPPSVPQGVRIYAVGDVHGRDDLLQVLLQKIEAEVASYDGRIVVVFLGDLIDRGSASCQVLERLSGWKLARTKVVLLCGNHEEAFLRVIGGETHLLHDWLKFGGAEFVQSYGIDLEEFRNLRPSKAIACLTSAIPKNHLALLRGMQDSFQAGDYFFAHAGVRPEVPLHAQSPEDLRWIRGPFLSHSGKLDAVVVHGHTISQHVEWLASRIGVDTGAYKTGKLSAVVLQGADRWSLDATEVEAASGQSNQGMLPA